MKEIFKSDRYFTLFDIVISHGQLLLRSQKSEVLTHNIDIIFFDTTYIQSFRGFKGIQIRRLEKGTNIIDYDSVRKYLDFDDGYIFEIESNNEKYYVAASFVRVFENQLEFSESSLNFGEKGVEIAKSF